MPDRKDGSEDRGGRISHERLKSALDAMPVAFVLYDAEERIVVCNGAYQEEYRPFADRVVPGVTHEALQWLKVEEGLDQAAVGRAQAFVDEQSERHRTGPGEEEWCDDHGRHLRLIRARLPNGDVAGMRFDITDLRKAQAQLEEQNAALAERTLELELAQERIARAGSIDTLTGLLNRTGCEAQLADLVADCKAAGRALAVLHVDLDGFKQVNDSLGREAGDAVLMQVGRRLSALARPGDVVGRMGPDDFLVAMIQDVEASSPEETAAQIVHDMGQPVGHNGHSCLFGASVGIALGEGPDLDAWTMIRSADYALGEAKSKGRNRFVLYDDQMDAAWRKRQTLSHDLLQALVTDELTAFFQPKVASRGHQLVGFEALIRWNHPRFGLLTPDKFIQIAEDMRLVDDLDDTVLRVVLDQRSAWMDAGLDVPPINVNVSSLRLRDPDLLKRLEALQVPAGAINFEILETVFIDHKDGIIQWNLDGLREMGILLELDDFGTGHSSISAVLMLRPDCIKIDRSFARNIHTSPQAQAVVAMTVSLAHSMGAKVTAEGVETAEQAESLERLGCDWLQGYYFGAPVPAEVTTEILRADGGAVLPTATDHRLAG